MEEALQVFLNGTAGVFLGIGVLYLFINVLTWLVNRLPKGESNHEQ